MNDELTKQFIIRQGSIIETLKNHDKITLCFAVMEIEAWFLGMYELFSRINGILSLDNIKNNLGYDLKSIDPQKEFYKPSDEIAKILRIGGIEYKKSRANAESICSKVTQDDLKTITENGRCTYFDKFLKIVVG